MVRPTCYGEVPMRTISHVFLRRLDDRLRVSSRRVRNCLPLFPVDILCEFSHRFGPFLPKFPLML